MKIMCEKCDGKGYKMSIYQGSVMEMPCEECGRKGYIQITMSIQQVGKLCRIGNAVKNLVNAYGEITVDKMDIEKWSESPIQDEKEI